MKKKIILSEGQYRLLFENDNQKFIEEVKNLINSGQIVNIETALQMGDWMKSEGIFDVEKYMYDEYEPLIDFVETGNGMFPKVKGSSFVEQIVFLLDLKEINLYKRGVSQIPKNIDKLKNLEYLHLGNNNIKELPEGLFKLKNLTKLDIGGNDLETISPLISRLKNLKELNLYGNPIQKTEQDKVISLLPNTSITPSDYMFFNKYEKGVHDGTELNRLLFKNKKR